MYYKHIIDTAMNVQGMMTPDEVEYLARMASQTTGQIVEVGSYRGRSAIALCMGQALRMENNPPILCVDPFESYTAISSVVKNAVYDGEVNYQLFTANTARYNIKHLRCDSVEAVKVFRDGEVKLLFIDGQHDFEHVKSDFEAWLPKLAEFATVIFHDNDEDGVKELLNLLQKDRRLLEVGGVRLMTAFRWYPNAGGEVAEDNRQGAKSAKSAKKKSATVAKHWSDDK